MRIAHLADAHLCSGRTGKLDPDMGLDQTLCDRYRAFAWCVEDAVARGAELLLVAGDILENIGGHVPTQTEYNLAIQALDFAGRVPVLIIGGNHELPKATAEANPISMLWRSHTAFIGSRDVCIQPDWHVAKYRELHIACAPWPNRQQLLASRPDLTPMGAEAAISVAMTDVIRGLAAERTPGVPSILLGHFSIDLAEAGSESRMMGLGSEFTIGAHDLTGMGFDAILLGHVHRPQQVTGLPIWYAGSPCQMDWGERGERNGYWLHDLAADTHKFRDNPHNRRHLKLTVGRDAFPPAQADVKGARVWVVIPPGEDADEAGIEEWLRMAGAEDIRIERQPRAVELRRETTLTEGMGRKEQLRAYLTQTYPEEDIDALMEEARNVEEAA